MYELVKDRLKLKKKILVVDDEQINQLMLSRILENDYEVLLASDGKQALDIMIRNRGTLSLVMLDLNMPVMDGYELMAVVKNDPSLKNIPVIVLTSDKSAEVRSLEMGADDFIPKPYDVPEVILARIGKTIKLYEDTSILSATQYDELTNLFNLEFFIEYAGVIDRFFPDSEMDSIVLNFNRFHTLNELYGRDFGDEILKITGGVIKDFVKDTHGIGCRSNADSFYVYVPHGNSEGLYDLIVDSISDRIDNAGTRIRIGIYPKVDRDLDMIKRFDSALLACNSIRGNFSDHIAYYNSQMHEKEVFAERLISDLEKGLSQKQFIVYYQPKFSIQDGEPYLSSAEALIRWHHPEFGMVTPGYFIPLFEENGMIRKLDRYIWKEAAAQVASWEKEFDITIPVSVNVSRIDMMDDGFVDEMIGVVDDAGITSDGYMLEVTESAYTDNSKQIISVVHDLREKGFKVEMDDFGTGYSSLNMLSELPVDVLKLDMRFIRNIHTNPKDRRMVELVVDIAKYLEVKVVAEGVEYEEQFELLRDIGVDVIQGYYFSKPIPAECMEGFIKERVEHDNNRKA